MLADQREELVDIIEESLDELNECYADISHTAELDIAIDDPVIRKLIADIKRTKNAVLAIAGRLVIYGDESDEDDED